MNVASGEYFRKDVKRFNVPLAFISKSV